MLSVFGHFQKFLAPGLLAVSLAFSLTACGEDEATESGVSWLKENPQIPANSGWKIKEVRATGKRKMEIIIDMFSATAANKLNSLSAMDKGEVARLACPLRGTQFWDIVGTEATVVVKLTSMGENQVTAICRR
jgi:hypothetical protein